MNTEKIMGKGARFEKRVENFVTNKFTFLFLTIILMLIFTPVFEQLNPMFIPFIFLFMMLAVIRTLNTSRRMYYFLLSLGILSFLFSISANKINIFDGQLFYFPLIGFSIYGVFLTISIYLMLKDIFTQKDVTSDTILGGISVYFFLGILWNLFYAILVLFSPDAISIPGSLENYQLLYFSFTTLTTLGYGDVLPVSWMARNLTILESTIGPLYLAVLIGRLVGLHTSSKE